MTLPAVIANKKAAELQAGLKKNASVIAQAVLMAEQERGESLSPKTLVTQELKPILMKYMKVGRDCGSGTDLKSCVFNPVYNPNPDATVVYKSYNGMSDAFMSYFDDGQFILTDGSLIMIENVIDSSPKLRLFISVDVNGFQKGPNKWGHDLFTFDLTSGKFLPMGAPGAYYEGDSYCSSTSSHRTNGISCTYKALSDINYFKNLPR